MEDEAGSNPPHYTHNQECIDTGSWCGCEDQDQVLEMTHVMVGTPKVLAEIASSPSTDLNHARYMMYDTVTACPYFPYLQEVTS